ncbi:unnamed protein product [Cladocopium goreaui]|uniref:30S ribosomal protein S6 n=1 Tax=Cladocopium goreaui TaxID=2562237 RepID=A0A9P1CEF2_9DINO|nr:unnamed protein product [Cladocopium goreaui]
MRVNFPMDVTTLLLSPDWKGGPLVVLHNKLGRPPSAMLGKNHIWLLPFVKEFPSKIPSGYFITDVYLFLDALFNKNVFHPDPKNPMETRAELAAEEAVKTKRCLQALRYLWRNAKEASHCPRVQMLKDYLAPSPLQERNRDHRPLQDSDTEGEGPADVNIEVVEDSPNSPEPSENGDNECGDSEHDSGDEGHGEESHGEEEGDSYKGRVMQVAERVDSSVPHKEVADTLSDSDESSLKAPTLRLDDCHASPSSPVASEHSQQSQESDPDMRDSQVGSGWLGKFYAKYGRFGKDENTDPNLPRCVVEGDTQGMLDHIRATLVGGNAELEEHPLMDSYIDHCWNALMTYGKYVFSTLKSERHFYDFVGDEKAQEAKPAVLRSSQEANKASTLNTGFRDALNLMKLGKAADEADEECSITPAPKKPRLSDEIAQGLEITPPPVVGMQSAKAMAKLKKQDMGKKSQAEPKRARKVFKGSSESNRAEDGERARVKSFKGYDLSDLPEAALPFRNGVYKGNHSYTVTMGEAAFEILCKHGAYVIKRCADPSQKPASAQVTWSRFGGACNAWVEACQRAGVMSSESS